MSSHEKSVERLRAKPDEGPSAANLERLAASAVARRGSEATTRALQAEELREKLAKRQVWLDEVGWTPELEGQVAELGKLQLLGYTLFEPPGRSSAEAMATRIGLKDMILHGLGEVSHEADLQPFKEEGDGGVLHLYEDQGNKLRVATSGMYEWADRGRFGGRITKRYTKSVTSQVAEASRVVGLATAHNHGALSQLRDKIADLEDDDSGTVARWLKQFDGMFPGLVDEGL